MQDYRRKLSSSSCFSAACEEEVNVSDDLTCSGAGFTVSVQEVRSERVNLQQTLLEG